MRASSDAMVITQDIRKVSRFVSIYGFRRTLFKVLGRTRPRWFRLPQRAHGADILMIGCGQFSFATIGYFIHKHFGNRFIACYDPDPRKRESFADFYGVSRQHEHTGDLFDARDVRIIYIASNHASHTNYGVNALARDLDVYVEKPLSVNYAQLRQLMTAVRTTKGRIYAGYNRPFSGAIRDLRQVIGHFPQTPFSINCFVSGHKIPPDHWYRDPAEGTRVCGNIGHWIDLMIHILSWRSLPRRFEVTVAYSNEDEPDDNVAITFVSELGDITNIMLSSRCEPFEGINETINLQYGDTIAKIDDFKHMVIWQSERKHTFSYWPKDAGHERAILQPFESRAGRDWHEVEHSTLLMLFVAGMVRRGERGAIFIFDDEWARLAAAIGAEESAILQ
jgi:predicted dehydrogenase